MFSTILISAMITLNAPANDIAVSNNESIVETSAQGVVFRSTQKLRSNDGRSIYFYSSGSCEMFVDDRLVARCRYNVQNGEVRLLDENGTTVYKGSYTMKSDGRSLSTVTISGTTYRAY